MSRSHRTLLILAPVLVAVGYYNLSFFRARARQQAAPSETPALASTASVAAPAAPVSEPVGPRARSYEEALARLGGSETTQAPSRPWNARDIFHREPAGGLAVVAGPLPRAAEAAGEGARPVVQPPAPPRVDGLIRTPLGAYAIVDGHLTRPGNALSPGEKVVGISRNGVLVSSGDGRRVLPLAGEVQAPARAWGADAPGGRR